MTRTSKTSKTAKSGTKRGKPSIPEPFRTISPAVASRKDGKVLVPKLVLSGEWLKAVGFPIGAHAYLTTDRRGELALHRLGLGFPRRLYIRAAPR
jgi:hypothetical protein